MVSFETPAVTSAETGNRLFRDPGDMKGQGHPSLGRGWDRIEQTCLVTPDGSVWE